MNDRNDQFHMDPWDRDFYETGSTKPPKNHGAAVAVTLSLVIVLSGLTTILSLLNIKLAFESKQPETGGNNTPMSILTDNTTSTQPEDPTDSTILTTVPREGASVSIQNSPSSVENVPQEGGLSYQEIYTKVIDSVVSISCNLSGSQSSGSGVILSADGFIVTNAHVVDGASSISVELTDGREFSACLVGSDGLSDLAVLYIQAKGLTAAEFGDSDVLRVGDAVAAIGDPLGAELRGTMTPGIVSGLNRVITTGGRTMTLIQTNAALNAGNSGGPLVNCYGQVIGINTMKITEDMSSGSVEGIGFAIPSTTVKEIVDQLLQQGYVSGRPDLGLTGDEIPTFYQRYYGFPDGLYITGVTDGSDAALAGIRAGDVLVSIDGTEIDSEEDLQSFLYSHEPGETVKVVIYRDRRYLETTLTLEENKG